MITRLVKMTFCEEKVPDFLSLFEESRDTIIAFKGCVRLFLFKDINNPCIFFTYSEWISEADLDFYRNSKVFKNIWMQAKACFAAPAEAWSLNDIFKNVQ